MCTYVYNNQKDAPLTKAHTESQMNTNHNEQRLGSKDIFCAYINPKNNKVKVKSISLLGLLSE